MSFRNFHYPECSLSESVIQKEEEEVGRERRWEREKIKGKGGGEEKKKIKKR